MISLRQNSRYALNNLLTLPHWISRKKTTHTRARARAHTHTHTHTNTRTHIRTYARARTYVRTYARTHAQTHAHKHTQSRYARLCARLTTIQLSLPTRVLPGNLAVAVLSEALPTVYKHERFIGITNFTHFTPVDSTLTQFNQNHTLIKYFFKIHFNINPPSTPMSLKLSSSFQIFWPEFETLFPISPIRTTRPANIIPFYHAALIIILVSNINYNVPQYVIFFYLQCITSLVDINIFPRKYQAAWFSFRVTDQYSNSYKTTGKTIILNILKLCFSIK
jgi:hypothetical protein